jgi:hypothetical protein
MRNQVPVVVSALMMFAACGGTAPDQGDGGRGDVLVLRAQEGQACSTDPADDPLIACTPSMELVCIATYFRFVTNAQEAMKFDGGVRQVFVCRTPCSASDECPQQDDICCPGQIHGETFDKKAACVPPGSCEAVTDGDAGS